MARLALIASLLSVAVGCRSAAPEAPGPCDGIADPAACRQCLDHPPLGEVGSPICQSGLEGAPNGATCCSRTSQPGACTATFFDGAREVEAACPGATSEALSPECVPLNDGRACAVDGAPGRTVVCPDSVTLPSGLCGAASPFWTGSGWIQACCASGDGVADSGLARETK